MYLPGILGRLVFRQPPEPGSITPMSGRLVHYNHFPAGNLFPVLREALPQDVVYIALEDNLQKGEDVGEEHPDLNHLDVAGLWQSAGYADEPATRHY